jgi:hypothetical protein
MPLSVRLPAFAAPVLLFAYGVLRLLDGMDGHHGPGAAWNAGHTCFFVAMLLLGILAVGMRRVLRSAAPGQRVLSDVATVAALLGTAAFLWVITGDLFEEFPSLPGPMPGIGPLLFQLGLLTLLVQLAVARRLPAWTPILVCAGFVLVAVSLDLIPIGAAIVLVGLLPLARPHAPAAARS